MTGLYLVLFVCAFLYLKALIKRKKPQQWVNVAAGSVVLMLLATSFFGGIYSVPTGSMEPSLRNGDYVAALKIGGMFDDGRIMRGDIVVFKAPAVPRTFYIKRVIGVPGDVIEFSQNKSFIVNGKALGVRVSESASSTLYKAATDRDQSSYQFILDKSEAVIATRDKWRLPEGYYFMAGDNRDHSWDSRYWENPPGTPKELRGLVHYQNILARYKTTFFNFNPLNQYDAMDGEMKVFRSLGEKPDAH